MHPGGDSASLFGVNAKFGTVFLMNPVVSYLSLHDIHTVPYLHKCMSIDQAAVNYWLSP